MLNWLTDTLSPRPIGLTRVLVGGAALIRTIIAWQVLTKLSREETLQVPYFDWFPEPTVPLAIAIVAVWVVAAVLFILGWRVALTGPMLLGTVVFTLALDQQTYSNHLYLLAWLVLLLTVADAGAGLNLSRRDRPVVRWPVLLIMMQLSIVYGFSAITKINSDFVSGRVLAGSLRGGIVEFPEALRTPEVLSVLALVVIALELFVAVFIWRARFRPAVFILGLGLHASIILLMPDTIQLLVFALEMLALYPLFLEGRLEVMAPVESGWSETIGRIDVLRVADVESSDRAGALTVTHHAKTTTGADAHCRILEHMVPWLWFAPLLRLPGVRLLHERWCDARATVLETASG
jgi:hypothetical protein